MNEPVASATPSPAAGAPAAPPPQAAPPAGKRRRVLAIVGGVFALCAIAYALYWFLHARFIVETDNAYVNGYLIQVMPQTAGTVVAVNVEDTDFVRAGQPLVRLDPADARVQLDQAEADLASTVRQTSEVFVNNSALRAMIAQRESDIARSQADVARTQADYERRRRLMTEGGVVSGEDLSHAQQALSSARSSRSAADAALVAAQQQLNANQSLTSGTTVTLHPNVERAAARVREAYLGYARATVPAPMSGYVAKRSVSVGQRVQPGAPLMSIVPLERVWVDANFKEAQLRNVRIGQPVTLTADIYGSGVEYRGKVAGLGAGTGAAFALLPAQNATGNWIKVMQRIPVRIELEPDAVRAHPLRVGLSMEASVDTRDRGGAVLAAQPRSTPAMTTDVYAQALREAQAQIDRIIAANRSRASAASGQR